MTARVCIASILFITLSLFIGCAPNVTITTSASVHTEEPPRCVPLPGDLAPTLDTLCEESRPLCYKIRRLPGALQSPEDDFAMNAATDISGDAAELLFFTSGRQTALEATTHTNPSQNIWAVRKRTDGSLTKPMAVTTNANVVHEGSPSLSPDGSRIFFAAKNRADTLGDCDLYSARIESRGANIVLGEAQLLPRINSKHFDSHPSISADGKTLYFVSNRPGGFGNTDIWFATLLRDGSWSEPVNAGASINSSCHEMTPFICADNRTLYYASDGVNSRGGFDLFFSTKNDDGTWTKAMNLGMPINTPADELFPATPPNKRADSLFYFTSNRAGSSGGYDLYVVTPNPQPPSLITLRGTVRSLRTREPVANARLFWRDRTTNEVVATVESNESGSFFLALTKGHRYEIGAQAEKFFHDTYTLDAPRTPGVREFTHDFFLAETLALRINFPFNDAENPYEFVLDETGSQTNTTWKQALEYVAINIASFRDRIDQIVLTGHTDPVGTDEYNNSLSAKRAEFIKRSLVTIYNVPEPMIHVIGKGKKELLERAPNEPDEKYYTRCRRVVLTKVARKDGGVR